VRKRVLAALERRPVVSGAAITCGWAGMTLALAELPPDPFWGPVYVNGVGFLAGLAFLGLLGLLGLLGRRRAVGLDHLRGGLPVIPVVLICATEAWPGLGSSFDEAVILVSVGLNEELWSRGVILTVLRRLGPYGCAGGTAALFGLQHLINLRWGQPLDDTVVQIIEAGAFGFAFAALRLRGASLWWLIATHAFADYASIMSPGAPPGWQQAALVLAEIGYGLWTLTRLPRDDAATRAPAFTL